MLQCSDIGKYKRKYQADIENVLELYGTCGI